MQQKLYNGRLDTARGVAALIVFAEHTKAVLIDRVADNHIVTVIMEFLAVHAVLVFFLLSGFLITKSITENIAKNGSFSASDYLASRLTRIYPPLIGALLICCLAWIVIHGLHLPGSHVYGLPGDIAHVRESYSFAPSELLTALTMRQSMLNVDGPLWSLFIEFQIYLIAMAVALFWQSNKVATSCGLVIGLLAFCLIRDTGLVFYIFVWGLGSAAALFPAWRRRSTMLAGTLAIAIAGTAILAPRLFYPLHPTLAQVAIQFLLCCFYCIVLFASEPRRPYHSMLTATGRFSYSLYVIHFPLLLLGLSLTQNFAGSSIPRTWLSAAIIVPVVLMITVNFAKVAENQRKFLALMKGKASIPQKTHQTREVDGHLTERKIG